MSENAPSPPRFSSHLPHILTVLVLGVTVYVRIRLLAVPLERDEGEFAYMGQLLLKGFPPFTHAYTMKLPGVSFIYAFITFMFGQSPTGIHLGLLIINALCIVLVYLVARRMIDNSSALIAGSTYAVLSLSQTVLGIFAHATHFVVLVSLAGFLLLLRSFDNRHIQLLFVSGLCFGLALTMKQHALLLILFALIYQAWHAWRNPVSDKKSYVSGTVFFLLGIIIPYALILLWVARSGMFDEFWFWTVQYAREYATGNTLLQGVKVFTSEFSPVLAAQPFLWLLAAIGGILLCTKHGRCADRDFVFGFLLFSFLSVCPGLVFRSHYFVLLLPGIAILVGAAVHSTVLVLTLPQPNRFLPRIPLFLWLLAISFGIFHEKDYLFTLTPVAVSRSIYGTNPFPEALQVAGYLRDHTTPNDRVAVLGSEPEIFFYADRLSATGYIYMYGLMENQPYAEWMQMRMIQEIEQARPKYIVYVNVDVSWLVRSSSKQTVLRWGEEYVQNLYELVGVIDIVNSGTTRYLWDAEAIGYTPVSGSYLSVYKRKGGY